MSPLLTTVYKYAAKTETFESDFANGDISTVQYVIDVISHAEVDARPNTP